MQRLIKVALFCLFLSLPLLASEFQFAIFGLSDSVLVV